MELSRERELATGTADEGATQDAAYAVGSAELPNLRSEGERLKIERDVEQLRAELAALRAPRPPWWRRASIVTTLTAIIAAVIPVTTAVQAHYQKERELSLQESKQAYEIRVSYLDRLDKPRARLRTLRFVLATTNDAALKAWAEAETKHVQAELNELDRKIAALEAKLETHPPPLLDDPNRKYLDQLREVRGVSYYWDDPNEVLREMQRRADQMQELTSARSQRDDW